MESPWVWDVKEERTEEKELAEGRQRTQYGWQSGALNRLPGSQSAHETPSVWATCLPSIAAPSLTRLEARQQQEKELAGRAPAGDTQDLLSEERGP